jgi:hypothetical protein
MHGLKESRVTLLTFRNVVQVLKLSEAKAAAK